jgi:hypothetical protein
MKRGGWMGWLGSAVAGVAIASGGMGWGLASAPPDQYEVPAGPVVHDAKTGLAWSQTAPGTFTHEQAIDHCAKLLDEGGGWRLPTMKELLTLVDVRAKFVPVIDVAVFPDAVADLYWTSSPVAAIASSSYAWLVNFGDGNASYGGVSDANRVRCVR